MSALFLFTGLFLLYCFRVVVLSVVVGGCGLRLAVKDPEPFARVFRVSLDGAGLVRKAIIVINSARCLELCAFRKL